MPIRTREEFEKWASLSGCITDTLGEAGDGIASFFTSQRERETRAIASNINNYLNLESVGAHVASKIVANVSYFVGGTIYKAFDNTGTAIGEGLARTIYGRGFEKWEGAGELAQGVLGGTSLCLGGASAVSFAAGSVEAAAGAAVIDTSGTMAFEAVILSAGAADAAIATAAGVAPAFLMAMPSPEGQDVPKQGGSIDPPPPKTPKGGFLHNALHSTINGFKLWTLSPYYATKHIIKLARSPRQTFNAVRDAVRSAPSRIRNSILDDAGRVSWQKVLRQSPTVARQAISAYGAYWLIAKTVDSDHEFVLNNNVGFAASLISIYSFGRLLGLTVKEVVTGVGITVGLNMTGQIINGNPWYNLDKGFTALDCFDTILFGIYAGLYVWGRVARAGKMGLRLLSSATIRDKLGIGFGYGIARLPEVYLFGEVMHFPQDELMTKTVASQATTQWAIDAASYGLGWSTGWGQLNRQGVRTLCNFFWAGLFSLQSTKTFWMPALTKAVNEEAKVKGPDAITEYFVNKFSEYVIFTDIRWFEGKYFRTLYYQIRDGVADKKLVDGLEDYVAYLGEKDSLSKNEERILKAFQAISLLLDKEGKGRMASFVPEGASKALVKLPKGLDIEDADELEELFDNLTS